MKGPQYLGIPIGLLPSQIYPLAECLQPLGRPPALAATGIRRLRLLPFAEALVACRVVHPPSEALQALSRLLAAAATCTGPHS